MSPAVPCSLPAPPASAVRLLPSTLCPGIPTTSLLANAEGHYVLTPSWGATCLGAVGGGVGIRQGSLSLRHWCRSRCRPATAPRCPPVVSLPRSRAGMTWGRAGTLLPYYPGTRTNPGTRTRRSPPACARPSLCIPSGTVASSPAFSSGACSPRARGSARAGCPARPPRRRGSGGTERKRSCHRRRERKW